jgi:hypothetical protein
MKNHHPAAEQRLERTRRLAISIRSCVGLPLKRHVMLLLRFESPVPEPYEVRVDYFDIATTETSRPGSGVAQCAAG